MRGAVDAERAAAHIGAVEIEFEDFVLGEARLQPDREKGFLHLALDGALVVQEQVLRQLLGDRRTALAHAAGLRVGDERARGAGDVDAEMVVEAAVFGGERRLDQIVRKIFQRNRVVVLDAAAADRIAVAVEERHREIGFLQPVVVGGFAERRHRERQHQDQPAEPDGGGFRQRLDEHPALPAADIEAVHEGRVPLVEFARALAGREQRRIDARVEVQQEVLDLLLPSRWNDLAHRGPWSVRRRSCARGGAIETSCLMLRQTQGAFAACSAGLGDSRLFYPSGGHKPMVWLTILMVRTNAAPGFFAPFGPSRLHSSRPTS